jgi:hypothetical protein
MKGIVLLAWFASTAYTGTRHNRSDKMHHFPSSASQAMVASVSLKQLHNNATTDFVYASSDIIFSLKTGAQKTQTSDLNHSKHVLNLIFEGLARKSDFNLLILFKNLN